MSKQKVLSDARWSCQSCGACCRGFSFGPVEEHIVRGLEAKNIAEHWEPAKEEWYIRHPQTGDLYFTHVDGHCIFLQEDNLCAIHARWGSEAKPWFCREYPFSVVEDEEGLNITVRDDCGGFHKSMDSGELVSAQVEEILSIVRPIPHQRFAPQQVVILPGLGVSVANWLQVESMLLEQCTDSAKDSVQAMRQSLYRMANRTQHAPSAPFEEIFSTLRMILIQKMQSVPVDPVMNRSKKHILSMLEASLQEGWVQPEVEAYFVRILHTRILGKAFARLGGFPAGMGFFLLEYAIFAHRGSREEVGTMYSAWRRAIHLRPFWEVIRGFADPLSHLFLAV